MPPSVHLGWEVKKYLQKLLGHEGQHINMTFLTGTQYQDRHVESYK